MRDLSHFFVPVEDRMSPVANDPMGRAKIQPNPIADEDIREMFTYAREHRLWFKVVIGCPKEWLSWDGLEPRYFSPDDYAEECKQPRWLCPKWARSIELIDPAVLLSERVDGFKKYSAGLPQRIERRAQEERDDVESERKSVLKLADSMGLTADI